MSTKTRIAATMVLAGTASLTLGLLSPSAIAEEGGHTNCPPGTQKLVKFEAPNWNKEPGSVVTSVTLVSPDLDGGSWTSTVLIAAVVVKGGSGEGSLDIITEGLPAQSGSYSNAKLLNGGENIPDISHVEFCTPTTGNSTTTTTGSSTTTTEASTTTTTTAATTTTTAGATTTTVAGATVGGVTETKDPAPVVAGVQEVAELPRTGSSADWLISLGVVLLLTGVILMGATRDPVAWRSGS